MHTFLSLAHAQEGSFCRPKPKSSAGSKGCVGEYTLQQNTTRSSISGKGSTRGSSVRQLEPRLFTSNVLMFDFAAAGPGPAAGPARPGPGGAADGGAGAAAPLVRRAAGLGGRVAAHHRGAARHPGQGPCVAFANIFLDCRMYHKRRMFGRPAYIRLGICLFNRSACPQGKFTHQF